MTRRKDIADVEKLAQILGHTILKCGISSEYNYENECHPFTEETVILLSAAKCMMIKNTPNWKDFLEFLVPVLEDCGEICSRYNQWHTQDASISCFNTSQIIQSYLQGGKLPMFGKGTFTSKAVSNFKNLKHGTLSGSRSGSSSLEEEPYNEPITMHLHRCLYNFERELEKAYEYQEPLSPLTDQRTFNQFRDEEKPNQTKEKVKFGWVQAVKEFLRI